MAENLKLYFLVNGLHQLPLNCNIGNILLCQVTDDLRQKSKQLCYGIIYGMGARALAEQLDVDEAEASTLMETFHNTFPGE